MKKINLACVLRFVVLLEAEPSPWSEVLSAVEQVFIKELCTLLRSSFPRSCLVSAAEKHPSSTNGVTMAHRRDGARFPQDVTLGIQVKSFNLGFIRPENLVSHGSRVL